MAGEIIVELKNGDTYLGERGGETDVDGDMYLVLENPRTVGIAPAQEMDADRIKILKEEIERVRELDAI